MLPRLERMAGERGRRVAGERGWATGGFGDESGQLMEASWSTSSGMRPSEAEDGSEAEGGSEGGDPSDGSPAVPPAAALARALAPQSGWSGACSGSRR